MDYIILIINFAVMWFIRVKLISMCVLQFDIVILLLFGK